MSEPTARRLNPAPQGRRMTRGFLALALVGVFLAGCAAAADVESESTPNASGEPTAGPAAPATEQPASPPTQPFDGDCAEMFSPEQVESVLGVAAALRSPELSVTANIWTRSMGGVSCAWDAPNGAAALLMAVYPAAVFPDAAVTSDNTCVVSIEFAERECNDISVADGGFWFSGSLLVPEGTDANAAQASVDTLIGLVPAATLEAGDPYALVPDISGVGTWPVTTDCAAIGETVDAAALLANPALVHVATSDDYASVDPGSVAVNGWWSCTFSGQAESGGVAPAVFVEFSPGASWARDDLAALPGAQEFTAEGMDGAILALDPAASPSASAYLSVFDGPNLLRISTREVDLDESFLPFAAALVAERNAAL